MLEGIDRPAPAALITQVVVRADDPAFASPTKPVGGYYTKQEAMRKQQGQEEGGSGWVMRDQPGGKGWRRVVPSPRPQRVVELHAIEALISSGVTVVCLGGGGVPVVEQGDGEGAGKKAEGGGWQHQGTLSAKSLRGVAAVVDKDASSVLLADALDCDAVVFSTAVPCVYKDFGKPAQARRLQPLTRLAGSSWCAGFV